MTSPNLVASLTTRAEEAIDVGEREVARVDQHGDRRRPDRVVLQQVSLQLLATETGIRNGESDGNRKTDGDAEFTTLIPTPCFPSYPSNHGSGTGGAVEMMRRLCFGAAGHDITISNTVPALGSLPATVITLAYTIEGDADDVADAASTAIH